MGSMMMLCRFALRIVQQCFSQNGVQGFVSMEPLRKRRDRLWLGLQVPTQPAAMMHNFVSVANNTLHSWGGRRG